MKPILVLLFVVCTAIAQPLGAPIPLHPPSGSVVNAAGGNPDSVVNIILEFREAPYFVARRSALTAQSSDFYERRFVDLGSDLTGLLKSSGRPVVRAEVKKKYYKAFFGAAMSARTGDISLLSRLPYVKAVHADEDVGMFLETSVPQTRTDRVWQEYGVKGEGIVVGILDTGIDYLHPALGGGFGRGFRIQGGYDFVNGDADPMDDNGHGTHVAGIIGANGADIQGFAPKCSIVAYKVLNANGRGKESDIIAAIERVVDPNLDGDDADKLDVVNISLGSSTGNPDDAKSTAVDNAVRLGVTFCIAAGNNGRYSLVEGKETNYYYTSMETIGSPGTARLAITVGAADKTDHLTDFSSKGPASQTFDIKPDLLAPGYGIHSLAIGGGLTTKSGTSMATPMIAGMAALLKSANHDLTPAEIKSALVHSARDLGFRVMQQGAGRADAYRAIGQKTFVVPATLSFGVDDPSRQHWARVETLHVANTAAVVQSYDVTFTGGAQGIALAAEPQSFTLAPGASRTIITTVTVDNGAVPVVADDILVFDGCVTITGTRDTLRIPWAFVRAAQMKLAFAASDPQFIGWGGDYAVSRTYGRYDSKIVWDDPTHARVIGAYPGVYDFVVYYPSLRTLVTKEKIQYSGASEVDLSSTAPTHTVSFDAVDNAGRPLAEMALNRRFLRVDLPETYWYYFALEPGQQSIRITDTSPNFSFYGIEAADGIADAKKMFVAQYSSFRGVSGDVHLSNDPSRYVKQTLLFHFPPGTQTAKIYPEIISINTSEGREFFDALSVTADSIEVRTGIASFDLFLMKPVDPVFSSSVRFHVNHSQIATNYADLSSTYFTVANDSVLNGFLSNRSLASYVSPKNGTVAIGSGPVFILNLSYNNSMGSSIQFDPRFRGPASEDRYTDGNAATYTIRSAEGTVLRTGLLSDDRTPFEVPAAKYSISYEAENYFLGPVRGRLLMTNNVDLTRVVPDPPMFTAMRLVDRQGVLTDNVRHNEKLTLVFSSKVIAASMQLPVPESTAVMYRKYGTTQWKTASVSVTGSEVNKSGMVFAADLSPASAEDTTAFDMKVRVVDGYGNSSELTLNPAFFIGSWKGGQGTDVDKDPVVPYRFSLRQNFPNPFNPATLISYEIPSGGKAVLQVYDILGRHVATLADGYHAPGRYDAVFDASRIASGMYVYRLTFGAMSAVRKLLVVK